MASPARLAEAGPQRSGLAEAVRYFGGGAEVRHVATVMGAPPQFMVALAEQLVVRGLLRGVDRLSFQQPWSAGALRGVSPSPGVRTCTCPSPACLLRGWGRGARDRRPPRVFARRTEATGRSTCSSGRRRARSKNARSSFPKAARYLERALAEPPPPIAATRSPSRLGRAEAMTGAPERSSRMRASGAAAHGRRRAGALPLWTGRVLMTQGRYRAAADSFRSGLDQEPQVTSRCGPSSRCTSTGLRSAGPPAVSRPPEGRLPAVRAPPRPASLRTPRRRCIGGRPAQESRAMALRRSGPARS